MTEIVCLVLVKNEDVFIERVVRNIVVFCDRIIVCDNDSTDRTGSILLNLAKEFNHIEIHQISTVADSHRFIESFAGLPVWIFGVDGDEIYDPVRLVNFREQILSGVFDRDFVIFGNVLNCTNLDLIGKIANGYLAPPCRSMTKLFNFAAIESWTGCPERLHGGQITFKPGYHDLMRHMYHEEHSWEESEFRCLHTVFLKRSSGQSALASSVRLSPPFIREYQAEQSMLKRGVKYFRAQLKMWLHRDYKYEKYHRGPKVFKDVTAFFPER